MSGMDELVAWLRAQLDEDEAVARVCAEMFPPPWEVADRGWRVRIYSDTVPDVGDHAEPGDMRAPCVIEVEPTRHHDDPRWLSERVEHIARHDPARVLADVAAKRRIVELHSGQHACLESGRDTVSGDVIVVSSLGSDPGWPCQTLRLLALPYADRPGFRDEWRPGT